MFCATFGDIGIVAKQFADCIVGIWGIFSHNFLHFDKIAILTKRPAVVIIKDGKIIFAVEQQQGGQNGLFG